jgi:CspA family cold shock protein
MEILTSSRRLYIWNDCATIFPLEIEVGVSAENITKQMTGTIKTLTDRGFGFIAREGEAKDLFFHAKDLQGVAFEDLKVGDTLNFEVVESDKGPSAKNITRA